MLIDGDVWGGGVELVGVMKRVFGVVEENRGRVSSRCILILCGRGWESAMYQMVMSLKITQEK